MKKKRIAAQLAKEGAENDLIDAKITDVKIPTMTKDELIGCMKGTLAQDGEGERFNCHSRYRFCGSGMILE